MNLPLLYLITNRQAFRRKTDSSEDEAWRAQIEAIRQASTAGCQLIQIREKDLSARALIAFTREVIAAARPHGAKVLVNDRLDVALAAGADGVHLRVTSLSATQVRKVIPQNSVNEFLVGVSTHSMAEAVAAATGGANFLVFGPVYDTPSKREYGAPLGLEKLAEVCRAVPIPILALGGINLANFREPLQQGAAGIAAIGLFTHISSIQIISSALLLKGQPTRK